jgi:hypothetical protein
MRFLPPTGLLTFVRYDCLQDILKRALGLPAKQSVQAADVGYATLHILKAGSIRCGVGDVHNGRNAARAGFDTRGECTNLYLFSAADIVDTARGRRMLSQSNDRLYHIAHITEASALRAITIYRHRLSCKCLLDKTRHDHAILAGLARSNRLLSATWISLCGVPVFDTTLVVVSRLHRGRNPLTTPGTDHVSHRLVRLGWTQREAVLLLYLAGCVLGGMALFVSVATARTAYAAALLVALTAVIGILWLEYHTSQT